MKKATIIVPVYNEAQTVGKVIRNILGADLGKMEREVIVVDDASTDETPDILSKIDDPTVRIICKKSNGGKGSALRRGFKHATGDIIIIQDADLEYDPGEYPRLIETILDGDADVVYGSRFLGGPHRVLLFWNYLGNQVLTLAANIICDLNLTDMETGHKAFVRRVIEENDFESDGFDFEPEFTVKVAKAGYRIYEVPISYRGRTHAQGKKIRLSDGLWALYTLVKYGILK